MLKSNGLPQEAQQAGGQPSWRLRPGVEFPNWSAIRSSEARAALMGVIELVRASRCWESYGEAEDRPRRRVLQHYGERGKAPSLAALAGAAGLSESETRDSLVGLNERDLLVFDAVAGRISGAYPFTDDKTDHLVAVNGASVYAMCAIDALGAGAMLGHDTTIDSKCRARGMPIRTGTRSQGTTLAACNPKGTVVWSGLTYAGNRAASSLCTVIALLLLGPASAGMAARQPARHRGPPPVGGGGARGRHGHLRPHAQPGPGSGLNGGKDAAK